MASRAHMLLIMVVLWTAVAAPATGIHVRLVSEPPAPTLQNDVAKLLDQTIKLDSRANAGLAASSTILLGSLLHEWNPMFSSDRIRLLLVKDMHQKGITMGLVLPALALVDASYRANAKDFARLVNPVITGVNPRVGALLHERLDLPTEYSAGMIDAPIGLLLSVQLEGAKLVPKPRKQVAPPPGLSLRTIQADSTRTLDDVIYGAGSVIRREQAEALPGGSRAADSRSGSSGSANAEAAKIAVSLRTGPLSGIPGTCTDCVIKVGVETVAGAFHGFELATAAAEFAGVAGPAAPVFGGLLAAYALGKEEAAKCASACVTPPPPATDVEREKEEAETQRLMQAEKEEEKRRADAIAAEKDPERAKKEKEKEEARQEKFFRELDSGHMTAYVSPYYDGPAKPCENRCKVIGEHAIVRDQQRLAADAVMKGKAPQKFDITKMREELRKQTSLSQ